MTSKCVKIVQSKAEESLIEPMVNSDAREGLTQMMKSITTVSNLFNSEIVK